MIRKTTVESLVLKEVGKFSAKDILKSNKMLFSANYTNKKSINYITVILHSLWKNEKLKKVSRGLFTNEQEYIEVDKTDWNSVIDFYCSGNNGFVTKEFLWMQKGLTKELPKKLVIYTNFVSSNQKMGNIEVRRTKIAINSQSKPIFELFELIQIADLYNPKHVKIIHEHISEYKLNKEDVSSYASVFKRRYAKLLKIKPW